MDQIHAPNSQDCWQAMAHGRSLETQGQREEAIAWYRQWLLQQPNAQGAQMCWYEYARLLFVQGHSETAENAFRSALELQPHFLEASVGLGKALEAQDRLADAIQAWETAIPAKPLQIELLNNIARVCETMHNPERAETALIDSLRLDNTQSAVITTLLQQRQKLCRWPVLSEELGVALDVQREHVGPLMSLALFDDPVANRAAVQRFIESKHFSSHSNALTTAGKLYPNHNKIRVGFLSADFRLHATSVFFTPLIEQLDRNLFEVVLLDITTGADPFPFARQHLLGAADGVLALQNLDDAQAAATIQAHEIDVLIDMAGLTAGARPGIVAQRPAPVQMSYIGFLGSSGIANVDFVLTTHDMFPHEYAHAFSEKPLEIEGLYLSFTADAPVNTGTQRADCDLPEDAFVYCALLNSYKITPEMFAAWMDILRNVPNSVLWLVEENPTMRANLEQQAQLHGLEPQRLRFSQRVHPAEYRTRLALADVFLDSSPYGNGATTRDVLSAHLPIITKPGHTMMSRLTAHMISAVGLQELVVEDMEAYVRMAIALGHDRDQVAAYKQRIVDSQDTSPLYNTALFAKNFGAAILRGVAYMRAQAAHATSSSPAVLIHQIYYNEETRQKIMPGFVPLDNSANLRPDWFEFWVILNYLREHTLQDNTWYGFFSPRFTQKTGLSAQVVMQTIEQAPSDTDVILFSHGWDQICYFLNPWEQGEAWHPGITSLTQMFLDQHTGYRNIAHLVTDSSNSVFSNYFVANKKFWSDWQSLAEAFFAYVEQQNTQSAIAGETSYGVASNRYPMKTFVQERFASLLLATGSYRVANIDPSHYAPIFSRIFDNSPETRRALQTCDWLKRQYRQTQDNSYLEMYFKVRQTIQYRAPMH
jgi:predicted O-linked N-acetylglucosamine transferase (SPINDLY family)